MTDRKKTIIFIVLSMIILLTIITYLFDVPIVKFVESIRSDSLDYLFLSITFASNVFIIFFFLTTLFLWKEHKRRWILPLWFASFFSVLTSYVLKVFVHRHRPFQAGWVSVLSIAFNFMRDNFNTWNFSFPSFQAMLVFSAVPLLNKEFKNFRYIWIIFACFVAFSRVYFGVHYLSDVMAGALIGYLIGVAVVKIEEKYSFGKKVIKKLKISN
jgi:undecaprenyl-diphosphatase